MARSGTIRKSDHLPGDPRYEEAFRALLDTGHLEGYSREDVEGRLYIRCDCTSTGDEITVIELWDVVRGHYSVALASDPAQVDLAARRIKLRLDRRDATAQPPDPPPPLRARADCGAGPGPGAEVDMVPRALMDEELAKQAALHATQQATAAGEHHQRLLPLIEARVRDGERAGREAGIAESTDAVKGAQAARDFSAACLVQAQRREAAALQDAAAARQDRDALAQQNHLLGQMWRGAVQLNHTSLQLAAGACQQRDVVVQQRDELAMPMAALSNHHHHPPPAAPARPPICRSAVVLPASSVRHSSRRTAKRTPSPAPPAPPAVRRRGPPAKRAAAKGEGQRQGGALVTAAPQQSATATAAAEELEISTRQQQDAARAAQHQADVQAQQRRSHELLLHADADAALQHTVDLVVDAFDPDEFTQGQYMALLADIPCDGELLPLGSIGDCEL